MSTPLPLEHLPDSVHELISIIGVPLTMVIIEHYAGRELSIPTAPHLSPRLIEQIGFDAVKKISAHYQGGKIDVPRCVSAMRAMRDQAIYADRESGATIWMLANKYNFTERGIRKALARYRCETDPESTIDAVDSQASLF